ncbi:MAG: NAD(P)/FAD-dependent oxidoreductase [Myxococcales bacterium]|nr:NAD(P)/FAD-dependent oxidoreductase [Myxococcales bacterium]
MSDATQASTLVLGAGPAGLAVAGALRMRGHDAIVVDRADAVGHSWRHHYRRLHLHTPKQLSHLPGLPWPAADPQYPSRQQVVDYLEAYAAHHDIRPRFGVAVEAAAPADGGWRVQTSEGEIHARHFVVASGYNAVPWRPVWPGEADFGGRILHSGDYRDGAPFRGQRVLVVGAGNSGAEIALDLWEHGATVEWSIRGPINVGPRDPFGVPAQVFGIANRHLPLALADALGGAVVERYMRGLEALSIRRAAEGPATQLVRRGRVMLLDVGTIDLVRQGHIRVRPGIEGFESDAVVYADGGRGEVDTVVLATGYRPALDRFLADAEALTDARGYPRWHGRPGAVPGLWFCGFANPLSGALRECRLEAQRIARAIDRGAT